MDSPAYDELSDNQLQLIDRACEWFEQALRGGDSLSLESQLQAAPEDIREPLFRELLAAELESRVQQDATPTVSDYETRFPEFQTLIQEAFDDLTPPRELWSSDQVADAPGEEGSRPSRREFGKSALLKCSRGWGKAAWAWSTRPAIGD